MTATRTPPAAAGHGLNGHHPSPTRSVSVGRIALAVMLIVGMSLAFVVLYNSAGERRPVLAVARAVAAGSVITAGDLTEARVSVDPSLRPIPVDRRSEVIGRPAGVDLVPGTLLTQAHIGGGPVLPVGTAVVGLALKAGQMPPGVRAGDQVVLVRSSGPAAGGPAGALGPLVEVRGEVLALEDPSAATGTTVVSVAVDSADAPGLAVAAAAGQVSLVVEGRAA